MQKRKRTDRIIIHCSATGPGSDIGVREIDQWHKARGWSGVGYHYVIRRDGTVEVGRHIEAVGAHAQGANSTSIGICMVGGVDSRGRPEVNYTPKQWISLEHIITTILMIYPAVQVIGHRDVPGTRKDCPCFDVAEWWSTRKIPTSVYPEKK